MVSIHAPAWGATCRFILGAQMIRRFNPRARVGRDQELLSYRPKPHCFNPRARVGRDPSTVLTVSIIGLFQSTRPRGARQA